MIRSHAITGADSHPAEREAQQQYVDYLENETQRQWEIITDLLGEIATLRVLARGLGKVLWHSE